MGLDEAGVGPAVGSMWAAAVHLPPTDGMAELQGLTDSKAISAKRRAALRAVLLSRAHYGLGEVTHTEIDDFGMAEARRLVFERALADYVARDGPKPTQLEVDGTLFRQWTLDGAPVPHRCTPRADASIPCVSAASILAKTTRDAQIEALCDSHPELSDRFDLRANKGYLSVRHLDGLRRHGRSEWHRASFRIGALGER